MYTVKEKKQLEKALKSIEKCNGNCKECEKLHIYCSNSEKNFYYAFGCDALPADHFSTISNSMRNLQADAIELLEFELS